MHPGLPAAQGLYDPSNEHDSCAVGFIVNLKGKKSHQIVRDGITALANMSHRGACGCENNTGDGAGLLIQIPHEFLVSRCEEIGHRASGARVLRRGRIFQLARSGGRAARARSCSRSSSPRKGRASWAGGRIETDSPLAGRKRPGGRAAGCGMRSSAAGPASTTPSGSSASSTSSASGSRTRSARPGLDDHKYFYFSSLSCRTLVYKGMLTSGQLGVYFADDLGDPLLSSALCMVHSRFSTNTFPSWQLAHPYRMISHNGEINTLRGNINWMRAREALFASDLYEPGDLKKIKPIIREGLSDSACLDNAVELLVRSGYSLAHAMMMLIPEAWENNDTMPQVRRDFYRYHSCLMEPWDGPASVAFTDGRSIGAVLDRNGLRPSRYVVTDDDRVIMASEVGALDIAPESIVSKGRLEPGKMFLVDLEEGRIIDDAGAEARGGLGQALRRVAQAEHGVAGRPAGGARGARPRSRHALAPADRLWLHDRRPQVHRRPDGRERRRGDRVDGHGHAAGGALRAGPAPLQLLQAALRAGDQPAARRDPRRAGDFGVHRRRRRGKPARSRPGELPADRARDADPRQ